MKTHSKFFHKKQIDTILYNIILIFFFSSHPFNFKIIFKNTLHSIKYSLENLIISHNSFDTHPLKRFFLILHLFS